MSAGATGLRELPRTILAAAALAALSAAAAAQVTGPIPNTGQDSGGMNWNMIPIVTGRERTPEDAGRDAEIEQKYRETLRTKIPDRKVANDPWRSVRRAPVEVDRHKVY